MYTLEELLAHYKEILASGEVSEEDTEVLNYFKMCLELDLDRDKKRDMRS